MLSCFFGAFFTLCGRLAIALYFHTFYFNASFYLIFSKRLLPGRHSSYFGHTYCAERDDHLFCLRLHPVVIIGFSVLGGRSYPLLWLFESLVLCWIHRHVVCASLCVDWDWICAIIAFWMVGMEAEKHFSAKCTHKNMTKGGLLLIFVRNLVKGKVKRRLSATVGDEMALRIYEKLLGHTHRTTMPF